jgi:hypothetical protein
MSVCVTVAGEQAVADVSMCYSSWRTGSGWCQYVLQ